MGVKEEREPIFRQMIRFPCLVLFRRSAHVFKVGQVRGFIISTALADRLWERDEENEPWSLIYFLARVLDVCGQLVTRHMHSSGPAIVAAGALLFIRT